MKHEMLLDGIRIFEDRSTIHAFLTANIPDGDVTHDLRATVVLEYPGENIMKFTLAQIEQDARNRLGPIE
ncbi:hypothetical protein ACOTCG_28105 [Achromobacter xylosoxidans]